MLAQGNSVTGLGEQFFGVRRRIGSAGLDRGHAASQVEGKGPNGDLQSFLQQNATDWKSLTVVSVPMILPPIIIVAFLTDAGRRSDGIDCSRWSTSISIASVLPST